LPVYQLFWIIKQYLNRFKLLLIIFCYFSSVGQHNLSEVYYIWITPLDVVQGHQGPHLCFVESLYFLPGMLKHCETVDYEFSQLKIGWSKRQGVRRYHSS